MRTLLNVTKILGKSLLKICFGTGKENDLINFETAWFSNS